jgi:hypothetical protein
MQRTLLPLHCPPIYYNGSKRNARSCWQAHGVLWCLREVLLQAEDGDAIFCAEAASVVANLINNTAEELDSVHLR